MIVVITERHEDVLAAIGHGETAVRTEYRAQVEELIEAGLIRRDVRLDAYGAWAGCSGPPAC